MGSDYLAAENIAGFSLSYQFHHTVGLADSHSFAIAPERHFGRTACNTGFLALLLGHADLEASGEVNTTDGTTNQAYVQLGEELYDGDLRLNNSATDAFGLPPATGSMTPRPSAPMSRKSCCASSTL